MYTELLIEELFLYYREWMAGSDFWLEAPK